MKRFIKKAVVIVSIPVLLSLGLLLLKVQWDMEIPVVSPAGRVITGGLAEIIVVPLNIYASVHSRIYNLQFECSKLVPLQEVRALMSEHRDVVKEIEQLHSNVRVTVREGGGACPGKAYIEITISGERDRAVVLEILKGKKFFGVPCNIINI